MNTDKSRGRIVQFLIRVYLRSSAAISLYRLADALRNHSPRPAGYGPLHLSLSAGDGREHLRQLFDERSLLFQRDHQVPVALALGGEGGKYPAAHTEIGRAHVRAFLSARKAEGDPSKIFRIH